MPRVVDRVQKRAELLDAAVDAIAERGLDGVKLVDIAALAGVTTGAIGYYFRDKNELLVATLEHLAEQLRRGGAALTYFWGDLGLALPTTDEMRRLWRVWLAYCGAAPSSPQLLEAYQRFYAGVEADIADHLRSRGAMRPDDLAGTIVATVDGIGLCATVAPDLWPADRQLAALDSVLAALDVPAQPSTAPSPIAGSASPGGTS